MKKTKISNTIKQSIGEISIDKLVFHHPKFKEVPLQEIAFIELQKADNIFKNKILGVLGVLLLIISYFIDVYPEIIMISGFLLIFISIFKKFEVQYVQVIFKIPKRLIIPISKKQIKEVNQLIHTFYSYQKSQLG